MRVTIEIAKKMLQLSEKAAKKIGVPMVIAIVDEGGNLVAQHRMDDALLASIGISLDKAYTAAATKISTDQLHVFTQPGQPLYGLNTCVGGKLIVFGGGYPITDEKKRVIGGIGVSGGTVEQDMMCAKAGLSAIE